MDQLNYKRSSDIKFCIKLAVELSFISDSAHDEYLFTGRQLKEKTMMRILGLVFALVHTSSPLRFFREVGTSFVGHKRV